MRAVSRLVLTVILTSILSGCGVWAPLEGRIEDGIYTSPGNIFRVDVPVMRNPFVKAPDVIRDERRSDGGAEVIFSVTDLGEAWRYGALPLASEALAGPGALGEISDEQLLRFLVAPSKPNVVFEEAIQLADGPGFLRIYFQDGASRLFTRSGSIEKRESAHIGVVVAVSMEKGYVLYAVGQFDMPMSQLRFFVEDVKMSREKVLQRFASEQAQRLRELTTSFRLQ